MLAKLPAILTVALIGLAFCLGAWPGSPARARAATARAAAAATATATATPTATDSVPLDAASPWPEMRRDPRNTGVSPIVARYHGDRPWSLRTRGGIFSTPVIGGDGTIYVGSADTYLYAISSNGRLRWRLKTGGLIDAAGALSAYSRRLGSAPLTFGSADGHLYRVTTPRRGRPRVIWRFRASVAPVPPQRVDWWEGNVAVGPGGNLYAGNTGGTAYAVRPNGTELWSFTAGSSLWTTPAFAPDGSSFWGSLDLHVYHLSAGGERLWQTLVPGYVISSPAIGSDGTVYVGSFDSHMYALDPNTGVIRWSFQTSDHVYASPALGHDSHGTTNAIYFASTNGSVYALTPRGRQRWRYDTGEPVRSSPVLGRLPGRHRRGVIYVGSADGRLYAIDAGSGRLRWSFNTTPSDPYLRVRNNLNASPALGRTGVYIAGQDGYVTYVPYDYCLHRRDSRCSTTPPPDLARNERRVLPVDVGGNVIPRATVSGLSPATALNLRLIVRREGQSVNAAVLSPNRVVQIHPRLRFTTQESGDGHYLYVVPNGFLRPSTRYRLRFQGAYTDNGTNMGNFDRSGARAGSLRQTITLRTARSSRQLGLEVRRNAVSAMTISHLSVPMPSFLASVNQIGFDSYHWIASTISRTRNRLLLWVIGALKGAGGRERVDPARSFAFPLAGRYQGNSVILTSPNVSLQFSFGDVPLRRFELRGSVNPNLSFNPGANLYAETVCATVPGYGAELEFTGICNPSGVLAASGTFTSSAYRGPASHRPSGVRARRVTLLAPTATADGNAVVHFTGSRLPSAAHHVAAILLADARTDTPVALNYQSGTALIRNPAGQIIGVRLTIPAGTRMPRRTRAYVLVDAFPLSQTAL